MCALLIATSSISPWHLEADASSNGVNPGEPISIDGYLFNGGTTPLTGVMTITTPEGFVATGPTAVTALVAAGGVLHARFLFHATANIVKGRGVFIVRGGGQIVRVTVGIGIVESAPPYKMIWMPLILRGVTH